MEKDKTQKRRVFLSFSGNSDTYRQAAASIRKLLQEFGAEPVSLDQDAVPGTTWVDSIHRCVEESDVVVGVIGESGTGGNVLFELGMASALNKPLLLLVPQDYPSDLTPPSGIPC